MTRIQATRGWSALNLGDLWRYRELLLILAQRDVKLRYKQTLLGVTWVVLQPLLGAGIFAVIFGKLARLPSDGIPYLVFSFCSLLCWNYLAGAVGRAGSSLVGQSSLITKVYFPRVLIPLSGTLSATLDLFVTLVVLLVMMAAFSLWPGPEILTLPAFLLLTAIVASGMSLWLSALSVYYRDFIFATPFLMQVWMYVTPVVFPLSLVPEAWRLPFALNPMVGAVEGVRWAAFGRSALTWQLCVVSASAAVLVSFGGLMFFRRVERGFADVV